MQALINIAAQLSRKNWSIVEDLFWDAAATVHHFKKHLKPCNPKDFACPTLPQNPQSYTFQSKVTKSMADNNPLHLSVHLFLRYCFFCAQHTAVIYSAFQFVLCSGSTLGCLRAWQFPPHFLVSDTAYPHYM